MATTAGAGRSRQREARAAGAEAARAAATPLGGAAPDLVLVFATTGYGQGELLAGVREVFPDSRLAGCSGEGIIVGPVSDEGERCVGVLAVRSDRIAFETFLVSGYGEGSAAAGAELARQVNAAARGDEFALLVFTDGLLGNAGEFLETLDGGLSPRIPVIGGAAGDALQFLRTHQYRGGEAVSGAVSAVLLRGAGALELAVSHGCMPIGLERTITRAEGAWVQEIDGKPAWSVFRQYLEGDPEDLNTEGAIHLSVGVQLPAHEGSESEPFIVRTPMGLNRETGALYFPGGGIEHGATIRLTRRDPERVGATARASAALIGRRRAGSRPAFVLQFDCAGRGRQLFGSRVAEQIVHPLQRELGEDTPWIGFHTYGEIAPLGGRPRYHNFTVALCSVYERAQGPGNDG